MLLEQKARARSLPDPDKGTISFLRRTNIMTGVHAFRPSRCPYDVHEAPRKLHESPPAPEVPVFGTFFRAFVPMVTAADVGSTLLLLFCAILNIVIALGVVAFPSLTPFRCDDPSLQASYGGEVLKMPLFMALVFAVPTVTISVLEVGRAAPVLDRAYWLGRTLRRYVLCLFILNIAVCVIKITVNSKRPHFIDSCKPAVNTSNGTLLVCTGEIINALGNASSVGPSLRDVDTELEDADDSKIPARNHTGPSALQRMRNVSSVAVYSTVPSSSPRMNASPIPSLVSVGASSNSSVARNLTVDSPVVVYTVRPTSTAQDYATRSPFVQHSATLRSSMQDAGHPDEDKGSIGPPVKGKLPDPLEGELLDALQSSMDPGPSVQVNASTNSLLEHGTGLRASLRNISGLGISTDANRSPRSSFQVGSSPEDPGHNSSTLKLPGQSHRQQSNATADVDGNIDEVGIASLVTEKDAGGPALGGSSNTIEYVFDNTSNLESSMTADRRRWNTDAHLITRQENTNRSTGNASLPSDILLRDWNRRLTSHNLEVPMPFGRRPQRPETTPSIDHGPKVPDEPAKHIQFGFHKTQSEEDGTHDKSRVIKNYFCAGPPEAVSRAGLAFPSGHTAAACYSGSYVIGYVIQKGNAVARRSIRMTLIVSLLAVSHLVAVVRVLEGMHRWWDVLAGIGLGDCWAILLVTWPME